MADIWILIGKWSGTEFKLGSEDLMIMKESGILGLRCVNPQTDCERRRQ